MTSLINKGLRPLSIMVCLCLLLTGLLAFGLVGNVSAAVTTGATDDLTIVDLEVPENSNHITIFGFDATSSVADTLNQVEVRFVNLGGFSFTDLRDLDTDSEVSGVGLYRDDGSVDDELDSGDTAIQFSSIGRSGTGVMMNLSSETVPSSVSGYRWLVVLRTSSTISTGDSFWCYIWTDDIDFSGANDQPPAWVGSRDIECVRTNVANRMGGNSLLGDPSSMLYEVSPMAIRLVDGRQNDTLKKLTLKFYDEGTSNFELNDLAPLSTDSSDSGVGLYYDDDSPGTDVWSESDDTPITFSSITSLSGNRVEMTFDQGVNKVNIPDSTAGQGSFDFHVVIRSSYNLAEADDFSFGIEADQIEILGRAGTTTTSKASNTTTNTFVADVTWPVVTGDNIDIYSNEPFFFYEADTDFLNGDDKVYYNNIIGNGNGQWASIWIHDYVEANPYALAGEPAFSERPTGPVNYSSTTDNTIRYRLQASGVVTNPLSVEIWDAVGHITYYNCTWTQDATDPVIDADWEEISKYIWTGDDPDKMIFRNGMPGTEYVWINGTSYDTGAGLNYSEFSTEPNLALSPSGKDLSPSSFSGKYGVSFASTAAGSPYATVSVYDLCGNRGELDMPYDEDTTNPVVTIQTPAANGVKVSGIYQIKATLTDLPDNYENKVMISFNGGSSWAQMAYDGMGSYLYNWDTYTYSDGSYTILVKGMDKPGNFAYDTRMITVENFPLSVDFVEPQQLDIIRGIYDVVCKPTIYTVQCSLYLDSTLVATRDSKDPDGNYSFVLNTNLYTDGFHILKAKVKGVNGNTTEKQISITIDNTAPVISGVNVDFPMGLTAGKPGDKVTVRAYIYENQTTLMNITCQANAIGGEVFQDMFDDGLHKDGSSSDDYYGTEKIVINATWAYHVVKIFATDEAGNTATGSISVPVDTHDPLISDIDGVFPWVQTAAKDGDGIRIKANISEDTAPVDIVMVLDDSGSMGSGPGSAKEAMLEAAREFINSTRSMDRVALFTYDMVGGWPSGYAIPVMIQPFIKQDAGGKSQTEANITVIESMSSATPIWDTIGLATSYCIANSTGIPLVIALTDGADDLWSDSAGSEVFEEGSRDYCPWAEWGSSNFYSNHLGKYNNYQTDVPTWYDNTVNQNRKGLLNAPVPVFTIGLGLEHHDPPNKSPRTDTPADGTTDTVYTHIDGTESGTSEYNLWRIASTSAGGQYYYAPDKDKLKDIYLSIADVVGDYDAPSGIVSATADITGLSSLGSVTMYDDGMHEDGASDDGVWASEKFQVQNINTGEVQVTVRAKDIAGNIVEKDGEIMVDNTNPLASEFTIHYFGGKSFAFDNDEVHFSVNTSDDDTSILLAYVNATTIGSDETMVLLNNGKGNDINASDTYYTSENSTVVTGMESFAYKVITFTIYDSAGNKVVQKLNLRVINDESVPVCSLISPIANESIKGSYTFQALANDDSGIFSVKVNMTNSDTMALTTYDLSFNPDTGYYQYQVPSYLLEDGLYRTTARAEDNVGKVSQTPVIDVYIDNNPPVLTVENPKPGDYLSGTEFFNVTAQDKNLKEILYSLDGGTNVDISVGMDTTKELDGYHVITFSAVDFGGHITTKDIPVYIDNDGPFGLISAPMDNEYISGIYTMNFQISDIVGMSSVKVTIRNSQGTEIVDNATSTFSTVTQEYGYSIVTLAHPDGPYDVEVWAKDKAGHTSKIGPTTFNINNDAPDLDVTDPMNNTQIYGGAFLVKASSPDKDILAIRYKFAGGVWKDISKPINTSLYSDGIYTLSVSAFDKGGKYTQVDLTVYIDNNKPQCVILNPFQDQVVSGIFTFEAQALDDGGIRSVSLQIDGKSYITTYDPVSKTYKFSMNTVSLGHRLHNAKFIVTDLSGYVTTAGPIDFIVDYLDSDGDGVPDIDDDFPNDPEKQYDTDGDNTTDDKDPDDDNDGVPDTDDDFPLDPSEWRDTDGDGIGDNRDIDDDNDGISDAYDDLPFDPRGSRDTDGDGLPDSIDTDDDGDGIGDVNDDFPLDDAAWLDTDHDGLPDEVNGTTDLKEDLDDDNDGVLDEDDDLPKDPSGARDTDGDGIPDHIDEDDDNDGVPDTDDPWPKNPEWAHNYFPTIMLIIAIIVLVIVFLLVFVYREKIVEYTSESLANRGAEDDFDEPRRRREDRGRKKEERPPRDRSRGRNTDDRRSREPKGRKRDRAKGRYGEEDEDFWGPDRPYRKSRSKRKDDDYEEF